MGMTWTKYARRLNSSPRPRTSSRRRRRQPSHHPDRRPRARTTPSGARERIDLDEVMTRAAGNPEDILAVDDVLGQLAAADAQAAELVKLRFFAGLTGDEAARALGISPRTADSLWAYARAWMFERLGG